MAGNDDDKDKEPKPKPSTEAGAGDTSSEGSGKVPPSPEGQGKVQGKKPGTSVDDENFFDTHSSDSEDSSDKKKKSKRRDVLDLLPGLQDVPEGRAQRSASRRSMNMVVEDRAIRCNRNTEASCLSNNNGVLRMLLRMLSACHPGNGAND